MPETIITPDNKSAVDTPNRLSHGSGKSHLTMREFVLQKLKNKDFIADQLKHVARAK